MNGRTCIRSLLLPALLAVGALSLPCSAEVPSWGWKAEEVTPYALPDKAKASDAKPAWGTATVVVPAEPSKPVKDLKPLTPAEPLASVKAYCHNIEDAALDARFLFQKAELIRLQEELAKRTSALEAKRAEYQQWLKRRDEFIAKAEGGLVELYSKIKPDAAAAQLAAVDEEAAAALLLRLNARNSSAILNQMDSTKAARLVSVMIGAAKPEKAPTPAAVPGAGGKDETAEPAEKKL